MKGLIHIKGDRVIWMVILILSVVSLLSVYSSSQALAFSGMGNRTFYYLMKQIFILIFGLSTIVLTHLIPYNVFSRLSQILIFIVIPLLFITLLFGKGNAGAVRWMTMPGGLTIQTSDLAKIVLITFIARVLSLNQENTGRFKEVYLPIVIALGAVCGLIVPANFSTAALLFITSIVLMFIGRMPMKFIFLTIGAGIAGFFLIILIFSGLGMDTRKDTWLSRWESFTHPSDNGSNYQANRALIAVVNGGILGKGPGNSVQKEKLPQANSDFIYAIIVEEYGLIGGIVVLFLYLWLLFRTGLIVRDSPRTFPALVSIGLSLLVVIQAIMNMAVAVNLVPVTGQTLPFISSGGSSVLFTSIAFGIILSTSWGIKDESITKGH